MCFNLSNIKRPQQEVSGSQEAKFVFFLFCGNLRIKKSFLIYFLHNESIVD